MSFNDAPQKFFGNGYALASNAISLKTSNAANVSIGTFTVDGATAPLTVSTDHNLKIGDRVRLTTTTTLPAGFSTGTDYYVVAAGSDTALNLSATKGGTAITASDTGTGTHSIEEVSPMTELTDALANASTGDSRAVVFALMEMLYQKFLNTASADRPSQMSISRSTTSSDSAGTVTRHYSVSVTLTQDDVSVSAE